MKPKLKMRLGDLLVQEQIITEEQLTQALVEQRNSGKKLGRTLIDLACITEEQLLHFLAQQLNIPFLDISRRAISPEVVNLLPEVQARRYRALVVEDLGDYVVVAMSDPADLQAMDNIEVLLAPKNLTIAVVTERQLLDAFDNLYRRTGEIAQIAGKLEEEYAADDQFDLASITDADSDNETTVVKLLQSIFEDAVQMRASDIHIEPGEKVLRIRQRIDGQLQENTLQEVNIASALVLRLKLMAGLDISEKRLPQDGRFHMEIKGHKIDVRMSTMPIYHGESVVMRLLDQSAGLLTLNETGMPAAMLNRVRKHIKRPHGMLLVTGPTGSGKTTTLYGVLSELNTADRKIITVEDPVEYQLPRINQVQVNHKIGLDFSNVLRTTLRQDPDIIMVGEMRDQETVEIGLRGALTGHFVLSTLHTNDAITSALRLLDMGAASYLVASALRVIIAQRLVRRVCKNCAQSYDVTPQDMAWLNSVSKKDFSQAVFKIGTGCQSCNGSGYRGRVGVFEILELDEAMIEAMRTGNPQDFASAAYKSPSFTPLAESALEYLAQGVTTIEEVAKVIEDGFDNQVPLSAEMTQSAATER
ncbi:type II/IV secretion system protein [Shewanella sp. Isolate11]|uniref:GspE/PulE family protein n=1 Tax=Shewanella sp. Isolate11 TaxID=2908530 RepID=UPI001EFD6003|nr:type II/IV secretion system protein [Shewanella sp. Isolate11]MCG9695480.1 Flp pilus assembly complex ATPase component TadA [Shewanella sp. Isolate11]